MSPSLAPQTRSKAASKSNANGTPQVPELSDTPLPELCVDGMDKDQIWAQLELRAQSVAQVLEYALESTGELPESDDEQAEGSLMKRQRLSLDDDDASGSDEDMDFEDEDEDSEDDEDESSEGEDEDDDDDEEEEGEDIDMGEMVTGLRDHDQEDAMDLDASGSKRPTRRKGRGKGSELDDGFFDLAAFNAQTEAAESRSASKGHLSANDDEEEDGEDEDEELDLFANVDSVGTDEEPQGKPTSFTFVAVVDENSRIVLQGLLRASVSQSLEYQGCTARHFTQQEVCRPLQRRGTREEYQGQGQEPPSWDNVSRRRRRR